MSKFLDYDGLKHYNEKIQESLSNKISDSQKGVANGVASLDGTGKVPSSQLPSYVDDVINAYVVGSTPFAADWLSLTEGGTSLTPEDGKIYVVISSGAYLNKSYRWSGALYVEIASPLVVVQEKGNSTENVMSQKAVTDNFNALEAKLNENIVRDPNKTYLIVKGTSITLQPPTSSTVEWGDGVSQEGTSENLAHTYTDGINYHLISISGITETSSVIFGDWSSIIDVRLAGNITKLGAATFRKSGLKTLFIPKSVTNIGLTCFSVDVLIMESTTLPKIDVDPFFDAPEKIIVPKSAINAYKSATGWSSYADKIVYEIDSSDIPDTNKFAQLDEPNVFSQPNTFKDEVAIQKILYILNQILVQDASGNVKNSLTLSGMQTGITYYKDGVIEKYSDIDNPYRYTLPDKTGVVALTSDVPDVSNLSSFSVEVW